MNPAPETTILGMNNEIRKKIIGLQDLKRIFSDRDIRVNGVKMESLKIQQVWHTRKMISPIFEMCQTIFDEMLRKFREILVNMGRIDVVKILDEEYPNLAAPVERGQRYAEFSHSYPKEVGNTTEDTNESSVNTTTDGGATGGVSPRGKGAKISCPINKDGTLNGDIDTALKSLRWVENYTTNVVITCKKGRIPLMGDLREKIPEDILLNVDFTESKEGEALQVSNDELQSDPGQHAEKESSDEVSKDEWQSDTDEDAESESSDEELTWFEETVLNKDFGVRRKYKKALSGLEWVKACAVGMPNDQHDDLHLLIECKKGKVPRMFQLKECFTEQIVWYIEFMPEMEDFRFLAGGGNDCDDESTGAQAQTCPGVCVRSGNGIYNENLGPEVYGTVGFFVLVNQKEDQNRRKMLLATCYHVVYRGKLSKDCKKAHHKLSKDSRNMNSPTRKSTFSSLLKKDGNKTDGEAEKQLGKMWWGRYNNRHDICFIEQSRDVKCDCSKTTAVKSNVPTKKRIVKYHKKGFNEVEKTGAKTGTTRGIFHALNHFQLSGEILQLNAVLVKDKCRKNPFALHGDSGSLVNLLVNDEKIPIAYVRIVSTVQKSSKKKRNVVVCSSLADLFKEYDEDDDDDNDEEIEDMDLYLQGCVKEEPVFDLKRPSGTSQIP